MATRVTIGVAGVLFVLGALAVDWSDAADRSTSTGAIDSEGLGRMLRSLGVKPRAAGSRYDFEFHSKQGGQEWDFAMSAVISQNGGTIWVMAWLEEMPAKASKVPAAALLRMLSENDRLGNGKFFAYDRRNRRFLMQRVVQNQRITSTSLRGIFEDVAKGVMGSHSIWSVARWNKKPPARQSAVPPAPPAERRRR